MDFECIDALLDLPEFRVTNQVIRPHELELHLERRDTYLVCPRCQGCCARIQDGRARCIRDLPMLDRPVTLRLHLRRFQGSACDQRPWEKSETFGDCVKWGICLRRDNWVSVRYAEELNSGKSSVLLQRADRHGILGQKPADLQRHS